MKEDAKNKQCQICNGYLFPDDDVVVCPTCGAPHHRDCYNTVGHCGVEQLHGTLDQYDKAQERLRQTQEENEAKATEETRTCAFCGRQSKSSDAAFCPYCGQPYTPKTNGAPRVLFNGMPVAFMDRCGGIPKDTKIEDVTADDLSKFVGGNSARYIPKFATLTEKNKGSWNWAAFLFPAAWSFGRKMHLNGILYLILSIASKLCFVPLTQAINSLGDTTGMTYTQLYGLIEKNISSFSWISLVMMLVGFLLYFLPRIFCGRFGDWHYRRKCIDTIKEIQTDDEIDDKEEEIRLSGSLNILLAMIGLLAETYLPQIIAMFLI